MRFGVCAPLSSGSLLAEAGYDYVEPAFASTLRPEEDDPDLLAALTEQERGARLLPEAWNVLLPGDLKVVGDAVDAARQTRYLNTGFERAAALGGRLVVFGSGKARQVPDGFSRETANRQLGEFLHRAGEAAARHGLTVAIEPLNTTECNILNSVGEATLLAQAVFLPTVTILSDLYHVAQEHQSYNETQAAGSLLTHVHVAGAADRRAPIQEDREFLIPYFRALKAMGYAGRISVEGQWEDMAAQAAGTLAILRDAWAAA